MTSMPTLSVLGDCDDPASVLEYARAQRAAEDRAGRELMRAAARWVSMHSTDALVGPVDAWHERALPLGGQGCPEVTEFAVAEFAAAMGKSTESGRRYLARAVEGHYRLTRCWSRLEAGDLPAWKLGMIADQTMTLSPAAAAFVDQHVAQVAHTIGPAQLIRLVEEAKARFDPEQTEADRQAAAETRHVAIAVEQVRQWCGNPTARVTVKPILDLSEHIWVMSYEASERLRDQTNHRDGTCAHPYCTRPAVTCDHEHRVPHDPDNPDRGPTCTCNQAPTCRRHHRGKTTGGWTYLTVEPGVYLWRSPLGYQYLRDHTGTTDVTPDEDRRRYARELIAHFGDQPPET